MGEDSMVTCASCSQEAPAGSRFCPSCGTPLGPPPCSSCGDPLTTGAKFCASCGTPVTGGAPAPVSTHTVQHAGPVAERRVTSVLFGDLVGFTTLSESRDPEEVRELLSLYFTRCRVVIGRYGGTVEKFIGDAVMAVWGVPLAHEDDAERAVRAGLELLQMITSLGEEVGAPGLSMRVGVVTGEVAVTMGATSEGMVAGDAVNTASRVQSTARPGEVWVDDTTRSLTLASIVYQDEGLHELKGKTDSVALFSARAIVAEVGGGQRVDGLEAPHIGRDRELRLVKELFHGTEESRKPRLVVIDGEPGVGKSRLVWEFEKYIDGLHTVTMWHRGRCLSYGEGVAFWALAEAVRSRLDLTEADTGDIVAAKLEQGLQRFVPDPSERDWLRPRLAGLIGSAPATGFARDELFTAWTTFLDRVSDGEHPVILVVDDAHHADDGLLDFIDHLLATAQAGIFVLALARPELLARRHDLGGRRANVIRLEPLDDEAMGALVDGLVDGLPAAARSALVERSEGIPLFAVETVRALIDRDAVVPRGGRYVPADGVDLDLATIEAPASLQALVAARLDALTPAERRLVTDASVLGVSFTREGLAALNADPEIDALLASLQRKELLNVQTDRFSSERGQFRFVQAVVRQVAYSTQSRRDRKTRHVAAADLLDPQVEENPDLAVVVAQHLLDAADSSSSGEDDVRELLDRAVTMLARSARRALALGAPAEAQRLFESAVARTDEIEIEAAFLHEASNAAWGAGDFHAAAAHARRSVEQFDRLNMEIEAGAAAGALAQALVSLLEFTEAIQIAQSRWDRLEDRNGAEAALAGLARSLAGALSALGDTLSTAKYVDRRVQLAEAMQDHRSLAHAHLQTGVRYLAMRAPMTAKAMYESAAAIARHNDEMDSLSLALNNLATIAISRDLEAALEYGRAGMEAARRSGVRTQIDYTRVNYVLALWTAGHLDEMEQVLGDLEETSIDPSLQFLIPAARAWISEARGIPVPEIEIGSVSDALADRVWLTNYELSRSRDRGELTTAARAADASLADLLAASDIDDDFMHLWPPLVLAAIAVEDVEMAERLLAPIREAKPGIVAPAVRAHYERLQGLVGIIRGDEPDVIEAHLRAGMNQLDTFGAVGLAAKTEEQLARWLVTIDRHRDADEHFEHARTTYEQIGAHGWVHALDEARTLARTTSG